MWYFRGTPHVHVWVNIADDSSLPAQREGINQSPSPFTFSRSGAKRKRDRSTLPPTIVAPARRATLPRSAPIARAGRFARSASRQRSRSARQLFRTEPRHELSSAGRSAASVRRAGPATLSDRASSRKSISRRTTSCARWRCGRRLLARLLDELHPRLAPGRPCPAAPVRDHPETRGESPTTPGRPAPAPVPDCRRSAAPAARHAPRPRRRSLARSRRPVRPGSGAKRTTWQRETMVGSWRSGCCRSG